jgi:uncharacterized protein (TIGR03067 family)
MKLTGAAILISRGMKFLQAAPAAKLFRSKTFRSIHMTRLVLALGIAGVLLVQPLGSVAAPAPKQNDPDLIQGTWKVVKLEHNGKVNTEHFREGIWVFKDKEVTLRDEKDKEWSKGTFVVDADKKPMTIDISWADGPQKGKIEKGIYKIEKDTLTLSRNAENRPDGFTDAGKIGQPGLLTFERVKAK